MTVRLLLPLLLLFTGCGHQTSKPSAQQVPAAFKEGNYAYDVAFLKDHTKKIIELSDDEGASRVLLSADYQGRVMTSTSRGDSGTSYGWLNYDLIDDSVFKPQFNPVGGEERFWLGPEGGQYSLYFKNRDSFTFANWQVPPMIDTLEWEVAEQNNKTAVFTHSGILTNHSGTKFNVGIVRKITLLDIAAISRILGSDIPPGVASVAYTSENTLRNAGSNKWTKQGGLLSIWLLAMLTPSDNTKVIIPFKPTKDPGKLITADYFGTVPSDRLSITDSLLVLKCDGKFRSKIGIPPTIAKPMSASFDFDRNILTITLFTVDARGTYVNSKWELQRFPYKGDAVNAYNDGPLADGSQMGPFYEIESSSPARELAPGEEQVHTQSTFHFEGSFENMEALAFKLLGIRLSEIR